MSLAITETTSPYKSEIENQNILILPKNYSESSNEHIYYASSISFYKFVQGKIDISFLSTPEILIEQRSIDWFSPIFLITSQFLLENPDFIDVFIEQVNNYISSTFKGKEKPPEIDFTLIHKETKTSKSTMLKYKGDIKGLKDLKKAITEISKKGN